mmetsp:Transcript_28570/g.60586  ORF Transcript_28570/g.60586 Transcript_28570/m.60586 type:complete len:260 (+) Transcript_28570:126-905(+)
MRSQDLETYFMRQALRVAKEALEIGEVPVGCVIVLRDVSVIDKISPHHDYDIQPNSNAYDTSPSVIISHGANQVNATRDATRHSEIVAIDRMLTRGCSSDQMKLPPERISESAHGTLPPAYSSSEKRKEDDNWISMPSCPDHWKNSYGWGSGRLYNKEILSHCDLYVTCEPCIMCAAALSMIGIGRVFFGCKNDRFGGCGSLMNLHRPDALPSTNHHGFIIHGGILEEEAVRLLRSFYGRENFYAPDHKRKRKPVIDAE